MKLYDQFILESPGRHAQFVKNVDFDKLGFIFLEIGKPRNDKKWINKFVNKLYFYRKTSLDYFTPICLGYELLNRFGVNIFDSGIRAFDSYLHKHNLWALNTKAYSAELLEQFFDSIILLGDKINWCNNNCVDGWEITNNYLTPTFVFKNPQDELAFKLVWTNEL